MGILAGILGGTFDPVHTGHLLLGEEVYKEFSLDRIFFIPSGTPPHKKGRQVADKEDRLNMLQIAADDNPHFYILDIELKREGYTYTVDTLRQLHSDIKDLEKLYFIIGSDNIKELPTWREFGEISRLCEFIAVRRPGFDGGNNNILIEEINKKYNTIIHLCDLPAFPISSTQIRERVKAGENIRYLVPEGVYKYIEEKKLYRY